MALTVGELNAVLSVDDQAMDPGLRRAEQALRRAGQRMGDDADDTGERVGQQLGQGLVRGADGQWRNLRGDLVDAATAAVAEAEAVMRRGGQRAGAALGDGLDRSATQAARQAGDHAGDALADGVGDGAGEAVTQAGGKLEKLKSVAGGAALAAGAAAGALLVSAMSEALDQGKIKARMTAGLNATPAQAKQYGQAAGVLFKNAVVENFQEGADAIGAIAKSGLLPPGATVAQIARIGTGVADLSSKYGEETGRITRAAQKLLVTGLAKSSTEAFDLISKGFTTSANQGEDFLDSLNEYSVQFKRLGLAGATAIGLMAQGVSAGARDSDQVSDALGQFGERATAGGKAVEEAFASIGVSADDVKAKLQKGGKSGQQALQMTLDALRGTKDEQVKLNAAAALFGDPANVMGDALYALDPASAAAATGMDKAAGSTGKLGKELRNNLGSKIDAFRNTAQQNLVDFLNGPVYGALGRAKNALGSMWDDAGKGGQKGVDRIIGFVSLLGKRVKEKVVNDLGPKVVSGLSEAGEKVAAWVLANPTKVLKVAAIAAAITMAIVMLPTLVAFALQAAAVTMVVGFVSRLISALAENVPKWWDSFTGWISQKAGEAGTWMAGLGTAIGAWFSGLWSKYVAGPVSRQWAAFLKTVQELPARTVIALASLAGRLSEAASRGWQSFRDSASRKTDAMIAWVKGIPGRISKGIGSLESLLVSKGRNIVQGLWSGIQSMGGWINSKILGWAKSVIPGPIAKALNINSPSKVTKAQGRWIARGLVDGLTGSAKQVKAASTKLADIVRDSLRPGKKRSQALGKLSAGTKQLLKLAKQEEALAARAKTATKKLADLRAAREKLATDVTKGILDSANITSQQGSEGDSAESILDGLRSATRRAQAFAASLAKLRKSGVRSDLIAQIAQAGVDQGSSAAAALAKASPAQVKAINAQQAALVKAAGAAGSTAGDAMYGAGIQAAAGLVKGLQSQQKAIDSQMAKIAKSMAASIRKALGIKSPSRVMALVGRYTAQGLVKGVDAERSAVNASMASLVDTPAPGDWAAGTGASGVGRQRPAKTVIEFRSSGSGIDNFILDSVRRSVRIKGGGDVQFVLGQGRTR
ncbi:phage tail tape measure protein [Streptomyces antibioticus]|uniref:phage tail tape measure protein n=1 Tax=Streptomyces antibioticus TaxID=1890 RepID=UPI00372213C9